MPEAQLCLNAHAGCLMLHSAATDALERAGLDARAAAIVMRTVRNIVRPSLCLPAASSAGLQLLQSSPVPVCLLQPLTQSC